MIRMLKLNKKANRTPTIMLVARLPGHFTLSLLEEDNSRLNMVFVTQTLSPIPGIHFNMFIRFIF